MIFIRGGPGSGKTWLANLILKKEADMGNSRCRLITANRYHHPLMFHMDRADEYVNNLQKEVEEVVDEGFYSFVVVELEGSDLDVYNKLGDYAHHIGGFEFYAIDIILNADICWKYNKHGRLRHDTQRICKEIEENPIPNWHKVINPIELIDPGWTARQPPPEPVKPPSPKPAKKNSKYSRNDYDDEEEQSFSCYG